MRRSEGSMKTRAEPVLLERPDITQRLRQCRQQDRAEHHAGDVSHAAQHDHAQDHDRVEQREALGADESLEGGEQPAGHTAEARAHGEGEQLHVARVDAHRLRGDLVLADRDPRAAYARILEPQRDEDGQQSTSRETR